MIPSEPGVWVFNGEESRFPAGVFATVEKAEEWIAIRKLSGVLTWYPVDMGVYEWVIDKGYWSPKRDDQKTSEFVQKFTSAYTGHYHYESGSRIS